MNLPCLLIHSTGYSCWSNKGHIVIDLINALPGNSSVNMVQHATIERPVFFADLTDAPIDWLDSDHVIYVYCRSMSTPRLYNQSCEL
jgi:hypothetical protein